MVSLENYGWNTTLQQYSHAQNDKGLLVGRIISIQGFKYIVVTEKGELETELSGKLLYGSSVDELPKVGDWVRYLDYDSTGYIVDLFPRTNALSRKSPGAKTERQVLATNIDFALIVQGLDRDFNLMRLERYLVQVTACGIKAIVVLNKVDLIEHPEEYRQQVEKLQRDCKVHFCSTHTGAGLQQLADDILEQWKTYILIGSSGVGKSSLLNALSDHSVQETKRTSDSTGKGKHTTTRRDLFVLPNGSLVIDTPGMREFGVTFEEGQHGSDLFPVIQEFASRCRFADCRHINEAGCAVIEGYNNGALDPTVYDSYIKLMKEQKRFQISAEEKKRSAKVFGKMYKEAKAYRKKYKY
jgi:ribosome biogenesis GTPase / thiamine phosphate phosphatase